MEIRLERHLILLYCFFSILVALATVYCIALTYHLGPFRDMWIAMDFIRAFFDGSWLVSDLFSLHGGAHRLAIPRLFFLLEYGVFSGTNVFLIIASIVFQLSVVGLVWKLLQQETHVSAQQRWFLTAMTLLLMLNATQLENFIYTFDMQWFVTSAAAVWALYFWNKCFLKVSKYKNFLGMDFTCALMATVVSLLASFSGLCLLLVLPMLLLAYRLSTKSIIASATLVILIIAVYMRGSFNGNSAWTSGNDAASVWQYVHFLFSALTVWIKWIVLYFGSPLGREYFWGAAIFSYVSLLFLFWSWIALLRSGAKQHTQFQMLCLSIALFAAAVGMATGLGRMYFVNTADEDRYQSIVAIYWLGIFGFAMSRALQIEMQQQTSRFKYLAMTCIIFWTCLVIPVASSKDAQAQVNFFDRVRDADLAIATGQWEYDAIKDTLILGDKWKKINRPEKHAPFLREKKWGIFANHNVSLLGTYLDRGQISADSCEGDIDAIVAISAPYQGYRIEGHGQNVLNESLLKSYLAIDESGRVVGLGRLQRQKDSLLPTTWQPEEQAHWLLYTTNLDQPRTLQILGILDGEGYCVMTSAKLPSHNI